MDTRIVEQWAEVNFTDEQAPHVKAFIEDPTVVEYTRGEWDPRAKTTVPYASLYEYVYLKGDDYIQLHNMLLAGHIVTYRMATNLYHLPNE